MKKYLLFLALCTATIGFSQPANDNPCPGAITAPTDGSCINGTTIGATPSFANPNSMNAIAGCGPNQPGADVWYSFTATDAQWSFNLTTSGTGPIGVILFDDGCTSGTYGTLSANCAASPATTLSGSYNGLIVGNTYYILVIANDNKDKDFSLCVTVAPPTGGGGPNVDCTTATPLCNGGTQSGNSNGFGTQELSASNQGCLSFGGEKESSWYTFTAQTSGTFTMDIDAQNGTDDYDFALWGPNSACPPSTAPLRCDFAGGAGPTGIGGGSNPSESAGGAQYTSTVNLVAGSSYVLLINNFSATTSPFDLSFGGTASLDCSVVLPIELNAFTVKSSFQQNELIWETASERNSDYFILEKSNDGYYFYQLTKVKGAGNSNTLVNYSFNDVNPEKAINYYRLTEVDINGTRTTLDMISIDNRTSVVLLKTVNLCGQEVNKDTKGIVFEYYSDGSVNKVYHN